MTFPSHQPRLTICKKSLFLALLFSSINIGAATVEADFYYKPIYRGPHQKYLTIKSNDFDEGSIVRLPFDDLWRGSDWTETTYYRSNFFYGGLNWGGWWDVGANDNVSWPRSYSEWPHKTEIGMATVGYAPIEGFIQSPSDSFLPISIRLAYVNQSSSYNSIRLTGYYRGNVVASDVFSTRNTHCPSYITGPECQPTDHSFHISDFKGVARDAYIFDRNVWQRPVDKIVFQPSRYTGTDRFGNIEVFDTRATFMLDDFSFIRANPSSILLKFDDNIDRRFEKKDDFIGGGQSYVVKSGRHAAQSFTRAEKDKILKATQEIFDRSGLGILVTDQADVANPMITVRFGVPLEKLERSDPSKGYVLGMAYDISPSYVVGLNDWLDRRNDGNVAVFMSTGPSPGASKGYTEEAIAMAVAHEVGHGLGVGHVVPISPGSDVMESGLNGRAVFSSMPLILEDVNGVKTSNPAYVIRRYALGESDSSLRALGIEPGSYDLGEFELQRVRLRVLSGALWDLGVLIAGGNVNFDSEGTFAILTEFIQDNGVVEFEVPKGITLSVFASSAEDGRIDTFIQTSSGSREITFDQSGEVFGTVMRFNDASADFETVGRVGFAVSAVPEPGVGWYYLSGLLFLLIGRRRIFNFRSTYTANAGMMKSTAQ